MAYTAIQYPTYQPAMRIITAITNAFPAQVTTSFPHQYVSGIIARLFVPIAFGMNQANELEGSITIIDDTNFTIDIDTRLFDPFVLPPAPVQIGNFYFTTPENGQVATVVPLGEITSQLTGSLVNVLPYN
jgi:hypothetical protein